MLATAPAPTVESPVTEAARFSYRLLQDRVGYGLLAYERPDGGLVCEHQRAFARPVFYRITAAGVIEPDQVLEPLRRRFTPRALPAALSV